jgi:uncharacterized membrane protein
MRRRRPIVDQRQVVVRVDVVIYGLALAIVVLALATLVWPGRVELALIGSLGTLMGSVLAGWLAFMRLSRGKGDDGGDDGRAC